MTSSRENTQEISKTSINHRCPLCGFNSIEKLSISLQNSMRSDGVLIDEPLLKFHCNSCQAIIGGNRQPHLPYKRSNGTSEFEFQRHRKVAHGIGDIVKRNLESSTLNILEIGGANFITSQVLKQIYPKYNIVSIEPNPEDLKPSAEIEVHFLDFFSFKSRSNFDVIYSNQVLEHIPNVRDFLYRSKSLLKDNGIIIVVCPSFSVCSNELLFSDHLYHFSGRSLNLVARELGLSIHESFVTPWDYCSHAYVFKVRNDQNDGDLLRKESCRLNEVTSFFHKWDKLDLGTH
jgi:SAM-dependent methyltransferase